VRNLDRTGIFKAVPKSWGIKTPEGSASVAVSIRFTITAQLEDRVWTDWTGFEEHTVYGDFWIVGKNGNVRPEAVEELVAALGWNGDLRSVKGSPPRVLVQITVKSEENNGTTYFKAAWIKPGDYSPHPGAAKAEDVAGLQARYGSLLRAAASTVKAPTPTAVPLTPAPEPTPQADPVTAFAAEGESSGAHFDPDVPF